MFSDIVVTSVIVSILYLVYRIHHAKRKCHHAKRKQIHALPDKIQDPRSRIRDPRYVITRDTMVIDVQILFMYFEEEFEGSIQLYVLHHRWGVKTPHNMCTATGTRVRLRA